MANAALSSLLWIFVVVLSQAGIECWEFCQYRGHHFTTKHIYCQYGCCGYYSDQYCCPNTVGIIVGSVFGGLLLLGVIISVAICCMHPYIRKGTIIHPARPSQNLNVAVVTHPYPPNQPIAPPPYTMAPPPAYNEVDIYPRNAWIRYNQNSNAGTVVYANSFYNNDGYNEGYF